MTPEEYLAPIVSDAVEEWATSVVVPAVFGQTTVTAAAEPEPNIEAILAATQQWLSIYRRRVTPALWAVVLAATTNALEDRQVGISVQGEAAIDGVPVDIPNITEEEILKHATSIGAATATAALVLQMPTWRDVLIEYITNAENMVVGMPEGVYRDLVKELYTKQMEGTGLFERSRVVRQFLDIHDEGGYRKWMIRAERIVRTETNNAMNLGIFQAAKIEESITGETLQKVWMCTLDKRTRDSHFQADGQRVPLDGKFTIGGYECDHPGDQNLPAHECINCRCTTIILAEDEELPSDADRQTERERSDGTVRSPAAEVQRRAERGVTRERDNQTSVTAAANEGNKVMRREWSGVLAPIGEKTGDGREFAPNIQMECRELPLPLLWQKTTSIGHDTAVIVGKITAIDIGDNNIHATGVMFDSPEATEATGLLEDGVIRPSVDLVDVEAAITYEDEDGNKIEVGDDHDWDDEPAREIVTITDAKIAGATLVSTPAFEGTFIEVGDSEPTKETADEDAALVASAAPAPVVDDTVFSDPHLDAPTALTVTEDGRVYGHLALWGTEHIGMRGVTPPHSKTGYAMFHVSTLPGLSGDISVGRLTVGCGHADTRASMGQAAAHYDQVGTTWAYVRAGEDKHGIWVAGMVNPAADEEAITAGAAAPLSGDWRRVGGNLELVAALSVNVPGFPVPRSYSATGRETMALVAAGVPTPRDTGFTAKVRNAVDEYLEQQQINAAARALAARTLVGKVRR